MWKKFSTLLVLVAMIVGCKGDGEDNSNPPNPNVVSLSVAAAPGTPAESLIQAGSTDVLVASFRFMASNIESIRIKKLRLYQAVPGGDSAINTIKLRVGGNIIATGFITLGYVTWENLSIMVPQGGSETVDVLVSFNDSTTILDIAGKSIRIVIRNLEDDWVDAMTPGAPNSVLNGPSETGDLQAEGISSGTNLLNNATAVDDHICGDRPCGTNELDSVGDTSFGANTLTKAQYLSNSILEASLSASNPSGAQGTATGADRDILRFKLSCANNTSSANPREMFIEQITFTIIGDAEADQFELYGPSDPVNPMATTLDVHRTTITAGNPTDPADHASITTTVTFVFTGTDRFINFGATKEYRVRAQVYAITDNDTPTRSMRVSIASYGTAQSAGDVQWSENGDPAVFTLSHTWNWIDDALGLTKLEPVTPMIFTGTSYIP